MSKRIQIITNRVVNERKFSILLPDGIMVTPWIQLENIIIFAIIFSFQTRLETTDDNIHLNSAYN